MLRVLLKITIWGVLGIALLGGSAADENQAADRHRTGLIPLDTEQVREIARSWPRITRVNVNWLGFERVNKIKAGKGKAPLDPQSVRPVGREVESSIMGRGLSARSLGVYSELAGDLPVSVDNSKLPCFPPVRDQGNIGSCASFATTYTQLSYMRAFQLNLDIRDNNDNTNKYSPKWSYNMVNGGADEGSNFVENYDLLKQHGACTWAELPHDSDYLAWCLSPSAWRGALAVRTNPPQYLDHISTDSGLEIARELLTDGYVLVFGTYIGSWRTKSIQDDPATPNDDSEAGKITGYWLQGTVGPHAMAIVGYNDAIWTDINEDGFVDPGEKGAFRVANSWGSSWQDLGFIWLAYDALRSASAVPAGPSAGRVQALQNDMVFVLTVSDVGPPIVIAQFTVNHARRDQLKITLGRSDTSTAIPSTAWTPAAIQNQGGAYAFNGSTTAVDGTFVFDFSDILVEGGGALRYYLGMNDNTANDPATLSAFKIIDLATNPPTEVTSSLVPQSADGGQQVYAYVDYAYPGPVYNHPPELSYPQTDPETGGPGDTYSYLVHYFDQDGDVPSLKQVIIDGNLQTMTFGWGDSASDGWYRYDTGLTAGSHDCYFYFEDGRGESARTPFRGTVSGPEVFSHMLTALWPSSSWTRTPGESLIVVGSGFIDGAVVCWDGSDRPTTFVNSTRLEAEIGAADLALGKVVQITVRNPGGGHCNALPFTIKNPPPNLTAISPSGVTGGGAGFSLTVRGQDFVPNSVVMWNGTRKTTTYVSWTELRASILAEDIASGGEYKVWVFNPVPAGGESSDALFLVSGFTMAASPASQTVTAGQSTSFSIRLTPQFGSFDSAVSFSCTGLPRGCTGSFIPASVIPGGFADTTVLTLTTKAGQRSGVAAAAGATGLGPPALALFLVIPALFFWFLSNKPVPRRAARRWLTAGGLVCLVILIVSCSSGGGDGNPTNNGTPKGSYYISVQGTSGNLTATTTVTLIVN
jgi:hypothetical protein